MPVRDEILEVVRGAAYRALTNWKGENSAGEAQRLFGYFEGRRPIYTGRYPILGLLQEMQSATHAGNGAASTNHDRIDRPPENPILGWDEHLGEFTTPMSHDWARAIKESASDATSRHFLNATSCFEEAKPLQGAEHLTSGVVCSIAAIAALKGWPHADREDDLNVVVGLATGRLPQNPNQIYTLLQSAPAEGHCLNSAYAAAMGQPDQIRYGFFYNGADGYDKDATLFAQRAVELAMGLASGLP